MFASPDAVGQGLLAAGFIAGEAARTAVYLAAALAKPLLVEGPAGVGKTELAKSLAAAAGAPLIRLQCYEGLDEGRALYEWNYHKQLLYLQLTRQGSWDEARQGLFGEEFLLPRPILKALQSPEPAVLLIDEIDKSDAEFESFLLETLSDYQVSIPEYGTVRARTIPLVVVTSNRSRDLSDALRRRCLYLFLDYPGRAEELAILNLKLPQLGDRLATAVVGYAQSLRRRGLRKPPSIAETLEWGQALLAMRVQELDPAAISATLPVLVKNREDLAALQQRLGWQEGGAW